MPSRRAYLAGVSAALAGAAGCVGGPGSTEPTGGNPTETPTTTADPEPREWGEAAEVADVRITPESAPVQHSAFHYVYPDTLGVTDFENQRAVFVTLETSGDAPESGAFELSVPDGSGELGEGAGDLQLQRTVRDAPYYGGDGWLAFRVSETDAEGGELRVETGGESAAWTLPDSILDSLWTDEAGTEQRYEFRAVGTEREYVVDVAE